MTRPLINQLFAASLCLLASPLRSAPKALQPLLQDLLALLLRLLLCLLARGRKREVRTIRTRHPALCVDGARPKKKT